MKRIKNSFKTAQACLLAGALAVSAPLSALAEETVPNTPKEEVVYVNLDAGGSAKEINVVNIFDLSGDGRITDYGQYQSLRNMTSTDPIDYADGTVTINAGAGKLYYEGKLDDNNMPWDIRVRYYMDGREYSAEEIAGMSGALKIHMEISQNTACKGEFFQKYALQASLTLDSESCSNIMAEDATIANVGSEKQLTYTILPGKGIDTEITADVKEFEMEGISINGVPLNLDVEVDDAELMDQVTDLLDAIGEIDDGAGEVKEGVSEMQSEVQEELQSGASELYDGANELYEGEGTLQSGGASLQSGAASLKRGASKLDKGIRSLDGGIGQIQAALESLNSKSGTLTEGSAAVKTALAQIQTALDGVSLSTDKLTELTAASAQIKTGIDTLASGALSLQESAGYEAYKAVMAQNGVDIDALLAGNAGAITAVNNLLAQADAAEKLLTAAGVPSEAIAPWKKQCVELGNQVAALLQGNSGAISGMKSYLDGISQGAAQLASGAQSLQENDALFDASIQELAKTLEGLVGKMALLSGAVHELVTEYEKLDGGIRDYTGGVAQIVAGYSQISDGAAQLVEGSGTLKKGTGSLYSGAGELLSGIVEIYQGTGSLRDGTGSLNEGVAELLSGIVQLYQGTDELSEGTGSMREETSGMDEEISDKIDELLETVTGGNFELCSFVSDKNTNVESVQFVIQTEGISVPEEESAAPEAETEQTFLQKLSALFE